MTKLLGLVPSHRFKAFPETFPDFVNRAEAFFTQQNDFDQNLEILGDVDDIFCNDMAKNHKKMRNENFFRLKAEAIKKFSENLEIDSKFLVVANGFYHHYLQRWYEALGKENVLVLSTEDLIANPYRTVKEFEKYFNLADYFNPGMFVKPYNGSFYCVDAVFLGRRGFSV